jgi:hypothetical protein
MPQIDIVKASLGDQDELKNLNPSNTGLASQTRCRKSAIMSNRSLIFIYLNSSD